MIHEVFAQRRVKTGRHRIEKHVIKKEVLHAQQMSVIENARVLIRYFIGFLIDAKKSLQIFSKRKYDGIN